MTYIIEVENQRISYLGPQGTYSHEAALRSVDHKRNDLLAQASIDACIDSIIQGEADLAVVPFENSTNGAVVFTYDKLRDLFHQDPKLASSEVWPALIAEVFVPINHCVLSASKSFNLKNVKKVYSHPQVWGQCDKWYSSHLAGVEKIDTSSTSAAVEIVKNEPESVAIAGRSAGLIHGVPVVVPDISNDSRNTTRFLIFAKNRNSDEITQIVQNSFTYISLISITVPHTQPGALYRALATLAHQNLMSITSRPSHQEKWHYVFFIEFEGHPNDPEIRQALDQMKEHCLEMRELGYFKRQLK